MIKKSPVIRYLTICSASTMFSEIWMLDIVKTFAPKYLELG